MPRKKSEATKVKDRNRSNVWIKENLDSIIFRSDKNLNLPKRIESACEMTGLGKSAFIVEAIEKELNRLGISDTLETETEQTERTERNGTNGTE